MSDEDKQKKIAHFFNKYELEETKKGEFTRYINLIEKNPKILEVYKATISQMLSDKIFASENILAN